MKLILFFLLLISSSLQIDESKALIIYFSRAGENYSVGTVDKGNPEFLRKQHKHDIMKPKEFRSKHKVLNEITLAQIPASSQDKFA